ncbi:MAG TPA: hypothetical protein VGG41_11645 [Solirubrobacteraceae bacterium]
MKVRDLAVVRPGDKSDNCHFAIVANDEAAADELWTTLTPDTVRVAVGAATDVEVERYRLPAINGIVIVVHDVLEGGAGYGWALEKRYPLAERMMEIAVS